MEEKKKKAGRPFANKELDKVKLLEIAIQEFANHGFGGAMRKNIAKKAGVANSMINYHFKDKEDLWKQAVIQLSEKLYKRFDQIKKYFKDLDGLTIMKAYTRQYVYFSAEHPEFHKIVFHEMCTQTHRAKWLIINILQPMHHLAESQFSEINKIKPGFEKKTNANLGSILIGATNTFFIHAFQMKEMYGINAFDQNEIEQHADLVIELLFARYSEKQ